MKPHVIVARQHEEQDAFHLNFCASFNLQQPVPGRGDHGAGGVIFNFYRIRIIAVIKLFH